ncbi:MAG: TonB C-terminal domain-containing protein [Acidobacteriaceae bacterium]|jgi:outer membrane biosynthesis protein TonB
MPILELFPKPARGNDQSSDPPGDRISTGIVPPPNTGDENQGTVQVATAVDHAQISLRHGHRRVAPIKVRTGRFGVLEEHELIHLLDTLDDERSRARFRESVYISVIIWLAIGWLLFYGPRVLFHVPQYRDPIAAMKEHDQQLTLNLPKAPPVPRVAPKIDPKTMEALKRQAEMERLARQTPPTPQPPTPQAAPPPPQEEAHNTAPPVPQPTIPLPAAPKPAPPSVELPSAPRPNFAQNGQSPHDALQNAMRGALAGRSGADLPSSPGSTAPLQAGVQILSDTQGVDFSAYMRKLHYDIQRNWDPLIPIEVQPPLYKKGITGIIFTILPDGEIGGMKLETTSGDMALDRAAWNAITSEGQFPPLPKQFHGPNLELRCGFFYNTPIQ